MNLLKDLIPVRSMGTSNNSLYSVLDESNNLLEHWAFINLSGLAFLLLCFITVVNILAGDWVIDRYKLDIKYP